MTKIDEVIHAAFADLRMARGNLAEAMQLLDRQQPEDALALVENAYGLINDVLEDKPR